MTPINDSKINWHVERGAVCVYSQLKSCSSSEVAAMMEGVLRHCTEMTVERQYVDSHGQSEIGFAFSQALGFQLLPRLKSIARQKLYRPDTGAPDAYLRLQPVLTRPIRWDLIRQQYDEMIKYATALRLGTADAESILRRFTRDAPQHPTYQALAELGKAVKTIFLCRYLHFEGWQNDVRVEQILPLEPRRYYPVCIGGRRAMPPEDCGGPWAFLELRQHYSAFHIAQRLLELLKPIPVADDRRGDDDGDGNEHDDDVHEHYEELVHLLRWLRIDHFDRRAANRALAQAATERVA
jgi:hypothetical protein